MLIKVTTTWCKWVPAWRIELTQEKMTALRKTNLGLKYSLAELESRTKIFQGRENTGIGPKDIKPQTKIICKFWVQFSKYLLWFSLLMFLLTIIWEVVHSVGRPSRFDTPWFHETSHLYSFESQNVFIQRLFHNPKPYSFSCGSLRQPSPKQWFPTRSERLVSWHEASFSLFLFFEKFALHMEATVVSLVAKTWFTTPPTRPTAFSCCVLNSQSDELIWYIAYIYIPVTRENN